MENQPIDTDAQGPFATGVGVSDQSGRRIQDIQPNWVSDGYGIRGPQKPVVQERAQAEPIELSHDSAPRSATIPASNGACAPTAPPGSGTWFWGTVGGICQWIDTTECTPPE